jgi:hypothetical protein
MLKTVAIAVAVVLSIGAARAEEEQQASAEEVAAVTATLEKIGCKAEEVEKESATLFEVDDAVCAIGQYDIKLDAGYRITSMTLDE